MSKKHKIETVTQQTHTVTMSREDLIRLARKHIGDKPKIPKTAAVLFHVPGGGDQSNTDLEVDKVIIRWKA